MKPKEYSIMYELEEGHWWFKGKRKIAFSQLNLKNNLKILDIGCGTGINMKNFEKHGDVFGIDIHMPALQFCSKRNLSNLAQADTLYLPFKQQSFDIVAIFDVLYHRAIKNDTRALKEVNRILKKNGLLIVTDSADMKLWGRHDIAVHARERYSISSFSKKLNDSGFKIKKITYFNTFLYPLVYVFRKLDNLISKDKPAKSNLSNTNPIINSLLYSVLSLESMLIKKINLPFGVSILAIAEKP
jgi:ubiquinone/menaquinone biosynthesis C-methylase UbiE